MTSTFSPTTSLFCLLTVCCLGSQSMFALLSLVHTFPHFFSFNLCKAGISRTSRNAVCFFFFFNSSREQKLFPSCQSGSSRMAAKWREGWGGVWFCFKAISVYGLQAHCSIKVFILFQEERRRVFILSLAQIIRAAILFNQCTLSGVGRGKNRCCRDLNGNRAKRSLSFAKSFSP